MLAFADRMNNTNHSSSASKTNSTPSLNSSSGISSSDHSSSTMIRHSNRKSLRVNPITNDEPTTPLILNTPKTCTKHVKFFPDYLPSADSTPAPGKHVCCLKTIISI